MTVIQGKLATTAAIVAIVGGVSTFAVNFKNLFFPEKPEAAAPLVTPTPATQTPPPTDTDAPASEAPQRPAVDEANAAPEQPAQTSAPQPRETPPPEPVAPSALRVPDVPDLTPAPERPAPEAPSPTKETLSLSGRLVHRVCDGQHAFSFDVAKLGTRPDSAIYLLQPVQSGRINVGETITLDPTCRLRLDRTFRTSTFNAEFTVNPGD